MQFIKGKLPSHLSSMEITKQTTQILLKQRQQKRSSSHEKKNHGTIKNESNTIIDETI